MSNTFVPPAGTRPSLVWYTRVLKHASTAHAFENDQSPSLCRMIVTVNNAAEQPMSTDKVCSRCLTYAKRPAAVVKRGRRR